MILVDLELFKRLRLQGYTPRTMLDIGANVGMFTQCWPSECQVTWRGGLDVQPLMQACPQPGGHSQAAPRTPELSPCRALSTGVSKASENTCGAMAAGRRA